MGCQREEWKDNEAKAKRMMKDNNKMKITERERGEERDYLKGKGR